MAGPAEARAGEPEDGIDGVVPSRVEEPATAETMAAVLAAASRGRESAVIRGGATKIGWGTPPARLDVLVSTARLNQLVAHRHADLTVTVQAGMRLGALNAALATHGQCLPLDSAFDEATIGGLVATNDAGPSRHRYGTPRDLLIGATLALTDGRVVSSGGHVVKNVAGYDLGRLVSGSHGSLAGIVEATFKLLPRPLATATLEVTCESAAEAGRVVAALTASQLDPEALDVHGVCGPSASHATARVLVRFASGPAAVDAQMGAAAALCGGVRVPPEDEASCWRAQVQAPWTGPGAVVRLAWLPAALPAVLERLRTLAVRHAAFLTVAGRAAVGAGHVRIDGSEEAQAAVVAALRSDAAFGHVIVLRAGLSVKRIVGVWGPPLDAAAPLQALKQLFDPAGSLNAGRGPV